MVPENVVKISQFLFRCLTVLVCGSLLAASPVTAEETCNGPKFWDVGLCWGEGVTVKVNIDPVFNEYETAAIKAGVRMWRNAGGSSVRFTFTRNQASPAGRNVLSVVRPSSVGSPHSAGEISLQPGVDALESAELRFNPEFQLTPDQLFHIVVHEMGHSFGLHDCLSSDCPPGTSAMTTTPPGSVAFQGTPYPTYCDQWAVKSGAGFSGDIPGGDVGGGGNQERPEGCKQCRVKNCTVATKWLCPNGDCDRTRAGDPNRGWVYDYSITWCDTIWEGCCFGDVSNSSTSDDASVCGSWSRAQKCEWGNVCCYDESFFFNTPTPTCTALGYYEEDQQEVCERESGRSCLKSALTRADCDSAECQARLCWQPPLSCGEMAGDLCSQDGTCPQGFRNLGRSNDCRACCKEIPTCGAMGGHYCSQNGTCPSGYESLGGSGDCVTCCQKGPSCGAMGGDYCSQSGVCPQGYNSLGTSWDCNPCCKSNPCLSTGCPAGSCGWQTDSCGNRVWCGDCMSSCGAMGGDYCSQTNTCPAGYESLGQSSDCKACCRQGPSCGAMGGDYCSQSGSCPGGFDRLGRTWDCNPCCKSQPDPCGGDPCCGDPCCGDPCCGDPCCGDPCCGAPCY